MKQYLWDGQSEGAAVLALHQKMRLDQAKYEAARQPAHDDRFLCQLAAAADRTRGQEAQRNTCNITVMRPQQQTISVPVSDGLQRRLEHAKANRFQRNRRVSFCLRCR